MLFTLSSVSLLLSGGLFARSLHHSHRYESTFSFPGLVKMFCLTVTSSRERLVSFSWVDPFSSLIFLGLCSNRFLQIPQRDTGFESGSWCGLWDPQNPQWIWSRRVYMFWRFTFRWQMFYKILNHLVWLQFSIKLTLQKGPDWLHNN